MIALILQDQTDIKLDYEKFEQLIILRNSDINNLVSTDISSVIFVTQPSL